MPMQSPEARVLCADRVSVTYPGLHDSGPVVALQNVNLTIQPGEFVVALGASGCGKTTLLSLLAGFLSPTEGRITLAGRPIEGPGADRGVVFQKHALLPWLNVLENTEFGLMLQGVDKQTRRARPPQPGAGRAAGLSPPHDLPALRRHAAARGHRPRADLIPPCC